MFELAVIVIAIALLPAAIAVVIWAAPVLFIIAAIIVGIVLLAYEPRLAVLAGVVGMIGAIAHHVQQRREARRREAETRKWVADMIRAREEREQREAEQAQRYLEEYYEAIGYDATTGQYRSGRPPTLEEMDTWTRRHKPRAIRRPPEAPRASESDSSSLT